MKSKLNPRSASRAAIEGIAVLVSCLGVALLGCGPSEAPYPEFGFQAYYEVPPLNPEDDCNFGAGPTWHPWVGGPHEYDETLDPRRLALESLTWFQESPEAAKWLENPTARLELTYPSGARGITARHAPDLPLSWEEQIRVWFTRFPPGGEGLVGDDEPYQWEIDLGDRGQVYGSSETDSAALAEGRSLVRENELSEVFRRPKFSLSYGRRRSSHEFDSYPVYAESIEQLDDLPRLVREKVEKYTKRN